MPLFLSEIQETQMRVDRAVIKQIVIDILKKIKNVNFKEFRFLGDSEQLILPGSAIDDTTKNSRQQSDTYVNVEVDDVPDENYNISFRTNLNEHPHVISCPKTKLDLSPVYQNRKITITLKLFSGSRTLIDNLISRITIAMRRDMVSYHHQLTFSYDLPPAILTLINVCYGVMEQQHGYGIAFPDWLKEVKNDKLFFTTRLDGEKGCLTVTENAVNVSSELTETNSEPRKNREDQKGVWSVEFDIELKYQRPVAIRAHYPPVINNQFLPEAWLTKPTGYTYQEHPIEGSIENMSLEKFKYSRGLSYRHSQSVDVVEPPFDDWWIGSMDDTVIDLVTSLVMVDMNDRKQFFNLLEDFVEFQIQPPLLKLLSYYPERTLRDDGHFFIIKLYEDNDKIPYNEVTIDSNLNIRLTRDMDPRKNYHIVFSLNGDPTTILPEIIDNSLPNKEGLIMYFTLFGDEHKHDLIDYVNNFDDPSMDFTKPIINNVISNIIEDNTGEEFNNSLMYVRGSSTRYKLRLAVIGEKDGWV